MSFEEGVEHPKATFRRVPVAGSVEQVRDVKVSAAGNITLIGLTFYPVCSLQPRTASGQRPGSVQPRG